MFADVLQRRRLIDDLLSNLRQVVAPTLGNYFCCFCDSLDEFFVLPIDVRVSSGQRLARALNGVRECCDVCGERARPVQIVVSLLRALRQRETSRACCSGDFFSCFFKLFVSDLNFENRDERSLFISSASTLRQVVSCCSIFLFIFLL